MNSDSRSINLANAVSIVAMNYLRQNYENKSKIITKGTNAKF